jgi:hypothetical protein
MIHHPSSSLLAIFLGLVILAPPAAYAHGAGNEARQVSGPLAFELGHDPAVVHAGEHTTLSVAVHENGADEEANTSRLWVRISQGDRILFASSDFRGAAAGPVLWTFEFPDAGDYSVDVSARLGLTDVSTSFALQVAPPQSALARPPPPRADASVLALALGVYALALTALLVVLLVRRTRGRRRG